MVRTSGLFLQTRRKGETSSKETMHILTNMQEYEERKEGALSGSLSSL